MRARTLWSLPAVVLLATAVPFAQGSKPQVLELNGYAEWHRGNTIIVDGQRLGATPATKFKGKDVTSLDSIPLGYEVKAKGVRLADGIVQATEVEAKPNGIGFMEPQVKQATDEIEAEWLHAGEMYEPKENGSREVIGQLADYGERFDRVSGILDRLRPPYVPATAVRLHIVRTEEWNAAAMGNGAVWVYSGLIDEMSNDELAIVLGHELAHYTHEHSRRAAKTGIWLQLAAAGAVLAADAIHSNAGRTTAQVGALLTVTAFNSGYSRDHEDQADRVGLRYAYEGGFDVSQGPRLWERFRQKYGNGDKITNFFFGGHSRPADRIKNIQRELAINYSDTIK